MRIDTNLPATDGVDQREGAAAKEAAGYDGLWTGEVAYDPFLALTLAATVTDRVRLGTSIALAFARNPMSTAYLADNLQAVSGGRLVLGLGTQVKGHVTRRFAMPWSRPARRMREYVLAMRAIWDCWHHEAALDFRGDFYSHTLMPPLFVPTAHGFGPPPVLLAGVGEVMTETAGEVADGFLCHAFTTERYLREVTLPALRRGRAAGGGGDDLADFTVVGAPILVTGATEEELAGARAAARERIAFYGSTPAYRPVLALHGWDVLADELTRLSREGRWSELGGLVPDEVLDAFVVAGTPQTVGETVHRRYGDLFTRVILQTPAGDGDASAGPVADAVRSVTA